MFKKYLGIFFILFLVLVFISCGKEQSSSSLKFKSFNPESKNIFFVVGAPNGLSGVATDVREMSKVLSDTTNGYNWDVRVNGNATKAQILEAIAQYAQEVGEDGTLGFYVSGHGSSDGKFMTANGMLSFSEVTEKIISVRGTPLKRLLTFNDSCYSGHWVDGNGALPTDKDFDWSIVSNGPLYYERLSDEEINERVNNTVNQIFQALNAVQNRANGIEQFFIMAAAKKTQTSLDYGSQYGGIFTYKLRTIYIDYKTKYDTDGSNVSIKTWAQKVSDETWKTTQHHKPVYVGSPSNILDESLFDGSVIPTPEPPQQPGVIKCFTGTSKYLASGAAYRDKFCKKVNASEYYSFAFGHWWKWLKTISSNVLRYKNLDTQEIRDINAADLFVTE